MSPTIAISVRLRRSPKPPARVSLFPLFFCFFTWIVLFLFNCWPLDCPALQCRSIIYLRCHSLTIAPFNNIHFYCSSSCGCSQGAEEEESDHLGRRFQRHQTAAQAEATQSRRGVCAVCVLPLFYSIVTSVG